MRHETRFCIAPDGVRLAYAVAGEGPPLVKAGNWLTHLEYDRQSPVWRHWVAELSRRRTFVRYDERGCGLSGRELETTPRSTPTSAIWPPWWTPRGSSGSCCLGCPAVVRPPSSTPRGTRSA